MIGKSVTKGFNCDSMFDLEEKINQFLADYGSAAGFKTQYGVAKDKYDTLRFTVIVTVYGL